MASPTVFNFYLPDFQPIGDISGADLVAPEFKLHNTASSIGYINEVHGWAIWDGLMYSWKARGLKILIMHTCNFHISKILIPILNC